MSCQKQVNEPVNASISDVSNTNLATIVNAVVTREYNIAPSLTDPAINTFPNTHFASVQEGGTLKNVLYVFLPGTYRDPKGCKATTQKAASLGFHSIGLMYPNLVAGNPTCKGTNDITCHSRLRLEVIDGIDRHPAVAVNPANSIINRLYKLLVYLNKTYPAQGWGQYILNGKPNWSKIIIAGHSQGAALAGVIGKYYPVKKVIMFSMIDYLNSGRIPDWEKLTANQSKFFGFTNTNDELVPYGLLKVGWVELGMMNYFGTRVNVDWNAYPYGHSHTLITTVVPSSTDIDKYHNSMGVDSYIPKNAAGKYIYDKTWEYLLTE